MLARPLETQRSAGVVQHEVRPANSQLGKHPIQAPGVSLDGVFMSFGLVRVSETRHIQRHGPSELADPREQVLPFTRGAVVAVHEYDGFFVVLWAGFDQG